MAILQNIWNALTGNTESEEIVTERPVANCPSDCSIAGDACSLCLPYKKKLIDMIYHVNHLDEYYDRYEVVSSAATGAVTCPHCGAKSENPYICDYCGSKLTEETGKIRVQAYSDIPNPIMEAQNIIYERYETVIKQYQQKSNSEGSGILSQLLSSLADTTENIDDAATSLGAKMSEDEIKKAASLYHVNVGDYLTGLDNGKYLTLSGKEAADAQGTSADYAPAAFGASGLAGIGMLAGTLLGRRGSMNERNNDRPFSHEKSHPVSPMTTRPTRSENDRPQQGQFSPQTRPGGSRPGGHGPNGHPGGRGPGSRPH